MTENKLRKYLFYAMGEIVLVVLGILIALQINNWNEDKKKEKQANIYLSDLKSDLNYDIKTLNERILVNIDRINQIDSIFYTLATKKDLSKEELLEFDDRHYILTTESYFIPEKSTISQIKASSQGGLIQNKNLRDMMFRYYSVNDRNEKNGEVSLQLYQHNFFSYNIGGTALIGGEYFEKLLGNSLNRPYTDYSSLSQNSVYIGNLVFKKENTKTQNTKYEEIRTLAENLLQLIEDELQKGEK
ncbi:MAG: DUF6090 family protein [Bacteroidota bacterium]